MNSKASNNCSQERSNSLMNKTFIYTSESSKSFSFNGNILNDVINLDLISKDQINNVKIKSPKNKNQNFEKKVETSLIFNSILHNLSFPSISSKNSKEIILSPCIQKEIPLINKNYNKLKKNNYKKNIEKKQNKMILSLNFNEIKSLSQKDSKKNNFLSFDDNLDFGTEVSHLTNFELTNKNNIFNKFNMKKSNKKDNCWNIPENQETKNNVWWEKSSVIYF